MLPVCGAAKIVSYSYRIVLAPYLAFVFLGLVSEGELWIGCLSRALLHGVGLEAVGRGEEVRLQLLVQFGAVTFLSLLRHFCTAKVNASEQFRSFVLVVPKVRLPQNKKMLRGPSERRPGACPEGCCYVPYVKKKLGILSIFACRCRRNRPRVLTQIELK